MAPRSLLQAKLRSVAPKCEIVDFCDPRPLADVFERTLLNFHPCEYDAYGMTVVEGVCMLAVLPLSVWRACSILLASADARGDVRVCLVACVPGRRADTLYA